MVRVKLAEWCDRWSHGEFSIKKGDEKDTTDDILALSMGRLVKTDEAKHVEKNKKQP